MFRKNAADQTTDFLLRTPEGTTVTSGTFALTFKLDAGDYVLGTGTATYKPTGGTWQYTWPVADTNADHIAAVASLTGALSELLNIYPVTHNATSGLQAVSTSGGPTIVVYAGMERDAEAAIELVLVNTTTHQQTRCGPTAGTFTLIYSPYESSAINYNATPAQVKAALEASGAFSEGQVVSVTSPGSANWPLNGLAYYVTFAPSLGDAYSLTLGGPLAGYLAVEGVQDGAAPTEAAYEEITLTVSGATYGSFDVAAGSGAGAPQVNIAYDADAIAVEDKFLTLYPERSFTATGGPLNTAPIVVTCTTPEALDDAYVNGQWTDGSVTVEVTHQGAAASEGTPEIQRIVMAYSLPTITIAADGGAYVSATNSPTEAADGTLWLTLAGAEMAASALVVRAVLAGCEDFLGIVTTQDAAAGGIDQSGVQAALTAQGVTTARAAKLDNLDAAVSTRASGSDLNNANANVSETKAALSPLATEANVNAVGLAVVGLDIPTASDNAYAVAAALATAHGAGAWNGNGLATTAALQSLQDLAEADCQVDTTTTPWSVVWKHKGTGAELKRKSAFSVTGDPITSTVVVLGRLVEVE